MVDAYQIEIPQSFMALFLDTGRSKPNAPRDVVAARYELCEDLACLLTEHAREKSFGRGLAENEVLAQCYRALCGEGAVVTESEALWVTRRVAELLEWPLPSEV